MNILAIDTSAIACSVAVCTESQTLSEFFLHTRLTHSQTLMPMVRAALDCAAFRLSDVDRFAVTNGPGSFTGLRIGIAAVKGLAMAEEKPCVPVSSLRALSMNLLGFSGVVCAVMDARCNQFYNALFRADGGNPPVRLCADRAISAAALYQELDAMTEPVIAVGDGAQLLCDGYAGKTPLTLAPEPQRYARASAVAAAAIRREPISCDALIPAYLRLPQAERERLAREQTKKENVL